MKRTMNPRLKTLALEYLTLNYVDSSRAAELHHSDLIYCLTRSYFDKVDPLPPTSDEVMLFSLGLGLQRVMSREECNPITVDGIILSPDFTFKDGKTDSLVELKTTRLSTKKKNPTTGVAEYPEFPETWIEQIKGYCYAVGQDYYDLLVLHMMGGYSPPFPELVGWRLEFTYEELTEHWNYILGRKVILETALFSPGTTMPTPFKHCKDWECQRCRYKLRCDAQSQTIQVGGTGDNGNLGT